MMDTLASADSRPSGPTPTISQSSAKYMSFFCIGASWALVEVALPVERLDLVVNLLRLCLLLVVVMVYVGVGAGEAAPLSSDGDDDDDNDDCVIAVAALSSEL
jgi:hypothetical protein